MTAEACIAALRCTPWCFCGSIASPCAALLMTPERAKRNNVLLPVSKIPSWPVEVAVP